MCYCLYTTYSSKLSCTLCLFSNTAGNSITEKAIKHWESGLRREDITLSSMEEVITLAAYNEKRGTGHKLSQLFYCSMLTMLRAACPSMPTLPNHIHPLNFHENKLMFVEYCYNVFERFKSNFLARNGRMILL